GSTAIPSWITPAVPATFSKSEKVATEIDLALNRVFNRLRPYSKMLTPPMGRPFPSKARWPSLASSRHFLQRPQVPELNQTYYKQGK
ncbi:MAG: hypothetical protein V7690_00005, partial [Shewanella sp.]|uniref:hypothetical protein n=1 Tax=Shewanella sp. TaxID=50422 RepID=UPI00300391A1